MIDDIATPRLVLRAYTQADKPALATLLCDTAIRKTYMIPDFPDQASLDRMVEKLYALSFRTDRLEKGVFLAGELIGFVNDVGIEGDSIEIGYAYAPQHWGKGYATEVLSVLISALFAKGFATVKAGAFVDNPASLRVMEKCGMERLSETEQIPYRGQTHTCQYYAIRR